MGTTKITAKLHSQYWKAFNDELDDLFIKRDGFLNHIIRSELPTLATDMEGCRLSGMAKRYVAGQLKMMGTETTSILVDKSTADALNEVVERTNMVRDAFMNRLVLFLRPSRQWLEYLELPHLILRSEFDTVYEEMPVSPLSAMASVFRDPFYYLRLACEERHGCGLYRLPLPDRFVGFSCFLEDEDVPGTDAHTRRQELGAALLRDLMQLETDAFSAARNDQHAKGGGK